MKPTLPIEIQHRFKEDKLWKNTYSPAVGDNFKRTLPDEVYADLLQYFEDSHGDRTIAELKELGYKVIKSFVVLAKTQGQWRGGFEVAIIVECNGKKDQALAYINPMGEIDTSWANGPKIK